MKSQSRRTRSTIKPLRNTRSVDYHHCRQHCDQLQIDSKLVESPILLPLVADLPAGIDIVTAMQRLQGLHGMTLLDSALPMERMGRFSYLGIDPVDVFSLAKPQKDPLAKISASLVKFSEFQARPGLPPFQGGWMGFLGYEFGRCFEEIPCAKHDEFDLPIAMFGLYDVVLAWDHFSPGCGWIFSSGLPFLDTSDRERQQHQRIAYFLELLTSSTPKSEIHAFHGRSRTSQGSPITAPSTSPATGFQAMAHGLTAPQFETRLGGGWLGSFDSNGFRSAVDRAREYIYAGDIFQVNLAQRLMKPANVDSPTLYRHLRTVNAAPFAGYMDGGTFQIISASPERFLQVHDRVVETRPIKGTRRRTDDPADDQLIAQQLLASSKDRAENTMIVDLLRNDLSRVCDPCSISVPQWCDIETYPYIMHMVSAVQGRLRDSASISELIAATFPGGSITGAPKVRAMEIIAELEPTVRGPYCGSMGYIGLDGSLDMNILIRTITASRGWWQMQVGGGIVADSRSDLEEEETWTKAAGLVKAIAACNVST